jgi:hypothetical protein
LSPITWKGLLTGTTVKVAVALEDGISSGISKRRTMKVEASRGVALSFLHRGADAVYLFNLFTGPLQHDWRREDYETFLETAASSSRLRTLPRRHPVTLVDPWEEGEPGSSHPLSASGLALSVRIPIGPAPRKTDKVTVALATQMGTAPSRVRLNKIDLRPTGRDGDLHLYEAPLHTVSENYNLVQIDLREGQSLSWMEVRVEPSSAIAP